MPANRITSPSCCSSSRSYAGAPNALLEIPKGGSFADMVKLKNDKENQDRGRDPTVEDPASFVLEKHLEDFLVANWAQTELGRSAICHRHRPDRPGYQQVEKELLVVELKKGWASDAVVGQELRYMGFATQDTTAMSRL